MNASRQQICDSTARGLARAVADLSATRAVVGLDGFVDEIIAVVDKRYGSDHYDPVRTIAAMGEKIRNAAGESSNYELVVKQRKLGGNGPIMANALACLGLGVTYIGSLGYPEIHPVFRDFARRAEVRSIAEPGQTDALEFDDGKLMLGKHESLGDVNWDNLVARVGRDELRRLMDGATLIGMVNWTMLPRMSGIWDRLIAEVLPAGAGAGGVVGAGPRRTLFIDLADPEKRTFEDIRNALGTLGRFQEHVDVILGLNLKEATEVANVLGLPAQADSEASIESTAAAIRRALGVGCVVIHPRRAAAAATEAGTARFAGPFVQHPLISTGAGDHFNAAFCLGRILGLGLEESLCAGVSCSGFYVRTAQSPSAEQLAEFIKVLPEPEPSG
jgi:sugar/nucleoside kinase (ribokinase family)